MKLFYAFLCIISLIGSCSAKHQEITIKIVTNKDLSADYVNQIAKLRTKTYQSYPYLLESSPEFETEYLNVYQQDAQARMIIAEHNGSIIGFVLGAPLDAHHDLLHVKTLLEQQNKYYYIADVIVSQAYRAKGIARKLMTIIHEQIADLGFSHIIGLTVMREHNHPLRTEGYEEQEIIGEKLGYQKTDRLVSLPWPTKLTNGNLEVAEHPMALWIRKI